MLLAVAVCFASLAQPLKIGVRAGLSSSSYYFGRVNIDGTVIAPSVSYTAGWEVAAVMRLSIPGFIHIQPEISYVSRDYHFRINPTGVSQRNNYKIATQTVEVPVTVGFNISVLRLFGGPVFTLSSTQKPQNGDYNFNIKFNKPEVGILLGAGIDVKNFFVDVRYTLAPDKREDIFTLNGTSQKVNIRSDEMWKFSLGFFF